MPAVQDSNYRFTLAIVASGDNYQVEAILHRAGLRGFFCLGRKGGMFGESFYKPMGVATAASTKLGGFSINVPDFRRPQF
jgi:hypothetical protein